MIFSAENNLVIIPARSGSVRAPGKNIRKLGKHPMLAWSILAAKKIEGLGRIYVSTDSSEYAEIAKSYGAEVPFLRSAATATSDASTQQVLIEAIRRYSDELGFNPTWVVILQPTSPFRSLDTIKRGIELFNKYNGDTVIAVARQSVPHAWMVNLSSDDKIVKDPESDQLPSHYICGSFYAVSADQILNGENLYTQSTRAVVVNDEQEALDIDTPEDLALAEVIAERWPE